MSQAGARQLGRFRSAEGPAPAVKRRAVAPRSRKVGIALLTLAFLLAFQFFFSFGRAFETHPLAPYLLMEATLGALLVWSALLLLYKTKMGTINVYDLYFFLTPLLFLGLSATFAWYSYAQPFVLGLSEDRRVLAFLFWFLFDPLRERYRLTLRDVLIAILVCSLIYLVVGLGEQIAIPGKLIAREIPDLDTRKLRISSSSEAFCICLIVGVMLLFHRQRTFGWLMLIVGVLGMVLIAQTRQNIIVMMVAAGVVTAYMRPVFAVVAGLVGALVVSVLLSVSQEALERMLEFLLPNISEFNAENLSNNTRSHTFSVVLNLLNDNYFVGLGAVSILHDDGLRKFYGKNFWINDVGIFGELFRVGFFYFGFLILYVILIVKKFIEVRSKTDRELIGAALLPFVLLVPTAGFMYRIGFVHAFLFLCLSAAAAPGVARSVNLPRRAASPRYALQPSVFRRKRSPGW